MHSCAAVLTHVPQGHIELATPIVHPLFRAHVQRLLGTICLGCMRLQRARDKDGDDEDDDDEADEALDGLGLKTRAKVKATTCEACGAALPRRVRVLECYVAVDYYRTGGSFAPAPAAADS